MLHVVAHFDQVDHPLHTIRTPSELPGFGASFLFCNLSLQRHHALIGVNVDVERIDVAVSRELCILFLKVDPSFQSAATDPRVQTRI